MHALAFVLIGVACFIRVQATETGIDEARLLAETDARIRLNRTSPLTVEVRDAEGRPVNGASVRVEHVKHRFLFGAGFETQLPPRTDETEVDRRHREHFLRLFNYSTDASGKLGIPAAFEGTYRIRVGGQTQTGDHEKSHPLRLKFEKPT